MLELLGSWLRTPSFLINQLFCEHMILSSVPVVNVFFSGSLFSSCFILSFPLMLDIWTILILCILCFPWIVLTVVFIGGKNVPSKATEQGSSFTTQYFVVKRWLATSLTFFSDTKPHFEISCGLCKTSSYSVLIHSRLKIDVTSQLKWLRSHFSPVHLLFFK